MAPSVPAKECFIVFVPRVNEGITVFPAEVGMLLNVGAGEQHDVDHGRVLKDVDVSLPIASVTRLDFGQVFKAFGNKEICPNLPHSQAIFVKVSKSIIF